MNGFEKNFQGLFGWFQLTFGWVVLPPSLHQVGLGLLPVLIPQVEQLHGRWCYRGRV